MVAFRAFCLLLFINILGCAFIFFSSLAKRKDENKIVPWFIVAASTFLVYQAITELFWKGTNKVINAYQKSPSEGISQLWDDWIGQDLIDTSQDSNRG